MRRPCASSGALSRVLERIGLLQTIRLGHAAILSVMSPFCTTRSAILVLIFSTENPGLSFSTTKPLTWSEPSSRAQITLMSAKVEFPIHFF